MLIHTQKLNEKQKLKFNVLVKSLNLLLKKPIESKERKKGEEVQCK